MEKAKMPAVVPARNSLRIAPSLWLNEARIVEVLELLKQHPEISEVAFFTSFTHSPLTMAETKRRAAILQEIMPRFREIGLSTGINHLVTIGHVDENLDNSLDEPWQKLIDSTGIETKGSYCLKDERMLEFVQETYRLLARTGADFIWIDDDMRLENHRPALHTCFCSLCLSQFSATNGRNWSRETLMAAFDEGTTEERLTLRRAWIERNRSYMHEAIAAIRSAVNEVNPDLQLGLMSSSLYYSGADFEHWPQTLSGERSLQDLPAKWRPGAGFYTDDSPIAVLNKAHTIGGQIARLPFEVTDIQYEHENFPYQRISKSKTMFVAEMAAGIGAGCTGVALNVMGASEGSIAEYEPCFDAWKKCSPFLDRAVATFGRSRCEGIGMAIGPDIYATINTEKNWLQGEVPYVDDLSQFGLPFAYHATGQQVTLLVGESVLQWSDEELLQIFSGGMMMDGLALQHLMNRGLEKYAGFAVGEVRGHDTIEKFSSDALNGRYADWTRDARPSFWNEKTYLLEPLSPNSRELSEIIDFKPQRLGVGSGIFENALGGRVAVMGYYPWRLLNTLAKTEQLKNLCRWLSRDTLTAYVEDYARAALWCRRDATGKLALMVLNASLDAQSLTVRVAGLENDASMHLVRMDNSVEIVMPTDFDGSYHAITIENLEAWQAALLFDGHYHSAPR